MNSGLRKLLIIPRALLAGVGVWQVFTVLPALSWFRALEQVTPEMFAGILVKIVVGAICLVGYFYLTRYSNSQPDAVPVTQDTESLPSGSCVEPQGPSPQKTAPDEGNGMVDRASNFTTRLLKQGKSNFLVVVIAGFILLAAFFAWPTVYRYDSLKLDENVLPVRIHRLTNETEVLYPYGWVRKSGANDEVAVPVPVPESELSKLEINFNRSRISPIGYLELEIYNGTERRLSNISVELQIGQAANGQLTSVRLQRELILSSTTGGPFQGATWLANYACGLQPSDSWDIHIVGAKWGQ